MDKASNTNASIATWRERIGAAADFPLHAPSNVERAMEAEINELRASRCRAQGGNTSEGTIGSPVSTAVGEPVATDLVRDLSEAIMANLFDRADVLDGIDDDLLAEIRAEMRETIAARLAAPTQVSAPQADSASNTRVAALARRFFAAYPTCFTGYYVDGEPVGKQLTEAARGLSAHEVTGRGAQASAAQEVRAVPEGWKLVPVEITGEMLEAAHLAENCGNGDRHFRNAYNAMIGAAPDAPTSTSTAPAAMDEKGGL